MNLEIAKLEEVHLELTGLNLTDSVLNNLELFYLSLECQLLSISLEYLSRIS